MVSKVVFLTSFFALCTSSLIAGFDDPSNIQQWLPSKLHSKTPQVVNLLKTEQTESVRFGANTDFGFSVRGINPLQADCLQEIFNQYAMQGVRPKVLDVAAGLGAMSWKAILAGGHVTAIELQKQTAEQMRLRVAQKAKAVSLEEPLKEVYRPLHGNAVTFRADKKYDVSWAGYFLHFLSPAELEQYVQKIYEITEDGGLTYATVNTPCSNSGVINLYKERETSGEEYPGYMIVNKEIYRSYNPATKEEKNIDVKIVGASAPLPGESLRPGYDERNGLYPTILEKPVWEDTENRCVFKRNVHSIMHYMGPVFLKNLFEKVGFQVERISYLGAEGEILPEAMTDEVLLNTVPLLGIKARKPFASSI